ncbi:hypothetical protein TrVE_jg14154 [Triparma verrucosa]|uniref:Hook C-terminal domain-containing protein n=1 Tax=Triparma verrucosa TaxID=1606542 RepID=A0A9W7F3Z8_9STRA|nr:hypothetical protein TrVE_jg14154 [Triparma verrucosa]
MSSPATATPSSALLAWLNCHGYEGEPITEIQLCDKAQELLDVANLIYDPLYDSRDNSTASAASSPIKCVPGAETSLLFFHYLELTSSSFIHNSPVTSNSLLSSLTVNPSLLLSSLRNLLVYAVSDSCHRKTTEVKSIMSLPRSVQKQLMRIIETGTIEVEVHLTWSLSTSTPQKKSPSPQYHPTSSTKKLRAQNQTLLTSLSSLKKENSNLKDDLHALRSSSTAAQLSLDLETLESFESRESNLKSEVSSLKATVTRLLPFEKSSSDLQHSLESLRDEIDVLKFNAAKVVSLEKQVHNYKDKVSTLKDVKNELDRERDRGGKNIDKLFKLEKEVKRMQGIKKGLEEYKKKYADVSGEIELKEEECIKLRQIVGRFEKMEREMKGEAGSNLRCVSELQKLLVESYGEDEMSCNLVGSGISELNPKVVEELNRLRGENEEIKKRLEEEGEENLKRLEEELEDVKLKSENFKKQVVEKKEEVGKFKVEVKNMKSKIKTFESEIKSLKKSGEEEIRRHETAMEDLIREHEIEVKDEREKHEDEIKELREKLEGENKRLSSLLDKSDSELKDTSSKLSALTSELNSTTSDYSTYKENHTLSNSKVAQKKASYESQISSLTSQISSLTTDRDFHLSTSNRLKLEAASLEEDLSQLRSVNSSSDYGSDNYEALQREYNVLLNEIKSLRNLSQNTSTISGPGDVDSMKVLRSEYDKKISEIKGEKRELVLNVSAERANLQKAKAREWNLVNTVRERDEEITSLKLEVERLERGGRKAMEDVTNLKGEDTTSKPKLLSTVVGDGEGGGEQECKQS